MNALSLVDAPFAWLEDPIAQLLPYDESVDPFLPLEGLKRELAMAQASMALGVTGPGACKRTDVSQLLRRLLSAGDLHTSSAQKAAPGDKSSPSLPSQSAASFSCSAAMIIANLT